MLRTEHDLGYKRARAEGLLLSAKPSDQASSTWTSGDAGFDVVRPDPAGTIQSLTSLGYTPEASIADLIDNSIAAGAQQVDVLFHWGGADGSTVSITDDGHGMTEAELLTGMTVGGRGLATDRTAGDLGRFGMGLKTASFAQCRQLIVATHTEAGPWRSRTWDVDHVLAVADWQLLHDPPDGAAATLTALARTRPGPGTGTIVLWRKLTRLVAPGSTPGDEWAQREFHSHIERIERHLAMVFGRYLTRRTRPLQLTVNGRSITGWDPFLSSNPYVDRLAPESPSPGVTVRGFVLPHRSRLTESEYEEAGGPRGWLDQQGFYVYRKDRLILSGDWLNLGFRKDERHVLARIAVDVPTARDSEWAVDVRKSTATPPPSLIGPLRRLGKATRERASAVITHKGKVVRDRQTVSPDVTWRQVNQFGRTSFRLNREHPLLVDLLARHPQARSGITALLRLIEDTLPVALIRVTPGAETAADHTEGEAAPDAVVDMASQVLEALVSQGSAGSEALQRLLHMPPFDNYPTLGDQLRESGR